ncbi:MAG: hypothetical protein QXY45_01975 [Candidatus Aenigmatarchaeota archaeon]
MVLGKILENTVDLFVNEFPIILAATIILFLGWFIGRILSEIIKKLLSKINFDKHFKSLGKISISEIISFLVKWTVYFVFISTAVEILGINTLNIYFRQIVSLISGILGGLCIIILGYLISKFLEKQVKKSNTEHSEILSQIIFIFTMVISISIALEIAKIPNDLINAIIIIFVASLGLGFAIAIGLGMKDVVAKILKKYFKKHNL